MGGRVAVPNRIAAALGPLGLGLQSEHISGPIHVGPYIGTYILTRAQRKPLNRSQKRSQLSSQPGQPQWGVFPQASCARRCSGAMLRLQMSHVTLAANPWNVKLYSIQGIHVAGMCEGFSSVFNMQVEKASPMPVTDACMYAVANCGRWESLSTDHRLILLVGASG